MISKRIALVSVLMAVHAIVFAELAVSSDNNECAQENVTCIGFRLPPRNCCVGLTCVAPPYDPTLADAPSTCQMSSSNACAKAGEICQGFRIQSRTCCKGLKCVATKIKNVADAPSKCQSAMKITA